MSGDTDLQQEEGVKPIRGSLEPEIFSEDEHPIRLADIDREALKVLHRLRDAGFAGYLVGGGVRDLYLGKRPKDFDISTDARPGQLRRLFRNSRTIGRRFRLVQVYFRGNKIIEVSTLRSQSEYDLENPEVLPHNNTFGTLEEDAFRRDLTINSLFYEIENHTIIDYVGGVRDLNDGIIRIVGDPLIRITRDPVRMLRAVRHAARTGFTIDTTTWQAIVAKRETLLLCPPSRIRDELLKDLVSGFSQPWARLCQESGLLPTLFPIYADLDSDRKLQTFFYDLLGVLDQLHRNGRKVRIPDFMLFAAFFYPWMEKEFDLLNRSLKGGGYRELLQQLREPLLEYLCERLNVKRAVKEAIATLYINTPEFLRRKEGEKTPKWLKRKSYYADCRMFSALVRAARTGKPLAEGLFPAKKEQDEQPRIAQISAGRRGRGGSSRPAFSSRKGGVFGLSNLKFE